MSEHILMKFATRRPYHEEVVSQAVMSGENLPLIDKLLGHR